MNKLIAAAKSPKVMITAAVLLAFAVGAIFEGYSKFGTTRASSSPEAIAGSANPSAVPALEPVSPNDATYAPPANPVAAEPAAAPTTAAPSVRTTSTHRRVRHHRSLEKQALIVGGSAAGGAAIGGIAGGGKGAGIGALSGGAAGLIYDLATKDK